MKKNTKRSHKVSKTPPPGWPSEEQWRLVEKKMKKSHSSKVLAPNADPVERTKHELCAQFIRYRREEKITQRELAKRLGVTDSRVSEILHYHHERFTIDKLFSLLTKIRPALSLKVA